MLLEKARPGQSGHHGTRIATYLDSLSDAGFWGSVTFKYQGGTLVHVVQEQSLKPEQLDPEYRYANGSNKH
jgi:hypothetical protein